MGKNKGRKHPAYSIDKAGWADFAALVLAVIVAGVFPLFFRNKFFDINRAKLALLQSSAIICAIACVVLWLIERVVRKDIRSIRIPKISLADVGATLFFASAALSTWLSDYRVQAFTGESGRRSGLLFLLALYLMYLVISRALKMRRGIMGLYFGAGVAAALLGVLNFYMIDPLSFYQNMKETQVIIFMSTIGNINFFGLYLCMVLCVGSALYMKAERIAVRNACALGTFVCFYGTIVSRSDGAVLGVALLFVLLLYYALADAHRLRRAAVLVLLYASALGCVRVVGVLTGWYGYPFQGGLCEALVKSPAPMILTAASVVLVIASEWMVRRKTTLPRKALRTALIAVAAAGVVAVMGLVVYFTWVNPQAQAGALTQFLRFDDNWGTYRGFVWTRSLDAYAQLSPLKKLIGTGPDTMRFVLAPYRDSAIEAAANGVFENCHNEYLQYLVTTGALGLGGYVLLTAGAICQAMRSRHSVEGLSVLLMLCVYVPLAVINVNQPVTVVQFFLAASLASCIHNGNAKEGRA